MIKRYYELQKQIKELEKELKDLKVQIIEDMRGKEINSIIDSNVNVEINWIHKEYEKRTINQQYVATQLSERVRKQLFTTKKIISDELKVKEL